jgi:hypothetical protein
VIYAQLIAVGVVLITLYAAVMIVFDSGYRRGKREGRHNRDDAIHQLRHEASVRGYGVYNTAYKAFRWKTIDEVIAERQKQRQEHVRTQMACACDRVDRWSEQND